jgi:acylphosphatase
MKAVQVRVMGKVQGVFYRASARGEAERLGLSGWARNMSDGSVALLLQGEDQAVDEMLAWCRVGPPGAEPGWLDVQPVVTDASLIGFSAA